LPSAERTGQASRHRSLNDQFSILESHLLESALVLELKARNGVNPRTLRKMKIPAMKLLRFRAAKSLKDAVKGVETKSGKKKK
jgi:hypothetical protein